MDPNYSTYFIAFKIYDAIIQLHEAQISPTSIGGLWQIHLLIKIRDFLHAFMPGVW